jgi:hypothetical protein
MIYVVSHLIEIRLTDVIRYQKGHNNETGDLILGFTWEDAEILQFSTVSLILVFVHRCHPTFTRSDLKMIYVVSHLIEIRQTAGIRYQK